MLTYCLTWWLRVCLQFMRPRFDFWVRTIPWRKTWLPTPVLLPGKFHGQRSLGGYSPWGWKESDMTERLTLSVSWPYADTGYSCFCTKRAELTVWPTKSTIFASWSLILRGMLTRGTDLCATRQQNLGDSRLWYGEQLTKAGCELLLKNRRGWTGSLQIWGLLGEKVFPVGTGEKKKTLPLMLPLRRHGFCAKQERNPQAENKWKWKAGEEDVQIRSKEPERKIKTSREKTQVKDVWNKRGTLRIQIKGTEIRGRLKKIIIAAQNIGIETQWTDMLKEATKIIKKRSVYNLR